MASFYNPTSDRSSSTMKLSSLGRDMLFGSQYGQPMVGSGNNRLNNDYSTLQSQAQVNPLSIIDSTVGPHSQKGQAAFTASLRNAIYHPIKSMPVAATRLSDEYAGE